MHRFIGVLIALAALACSRDSTQDAKSATSPGDVEAIRQAYRQFASANLSGDVEKELATVTDDAVFMPPGVADVVGQAALRARWTPREAADSLELFDVDPGEIVVVGDLAYSRGTSTARSRNRKTGKVTVEVVRHLDILRRQSDGRWLVSRHIRNTSAPGTP